MPRFRSHLQQGLWAECAFAARAIELGLTLSRPLDHAARYDFVVENRTGRLARVQVKSVNGERHRAYPVNITTTRYPRYSPREIDFLAAFVIPRDVWYIIPVRAIADTGMIYLRPHRQCRPRRFDFEPYREAWPLLLGKAKGLRSSA